MRGLGEHTAGRAHLACEAGEGLAEEATHELKLGEGGVSRVGKAVRRVLPVEGMVFVKLGWRRGHQAFKEERGQDCSSLETKGKTEERPGWVRSCRAS